MNRADVYKLIDGERDYQDSLWPTPAAVPHHSVGDYLIMLRYYGRLADAAWTANAGDAPALNVIRKITAIGVHCMEEHGAPVREWWHRDVPTVAQSMMVADPSKVYVLLFRGLLVDVFRNKLDAHKEAVRRAEQEQRDIADFLIEALVMKPDSGERLPLPT